MNFSLISKRRNELMGIAILGVMISHWRDCFDIHHAPISQFVLFLSRSVIGLDMFFLLSGFGLFYSFVKESNILNFYKKRFFKLFPAYFLVAIPYFYYLDIVLAHKSFLEYLKDIFCVSAVLNETLIFWYIPAISILYLLFPFFYKFIFSEKTSVIKSFRIKTYILIFISLIIAVFLHTIQKNSLFLDRLFGRIPVFLIGIYWGYKSYNKHDFQLYDYLSIPVANIILHIIYKLSFFDFLTSRFPIYYLDGLLALLFTESILIVFHFISYDSLYQLFNWLGKITLEIYLLHMCSLYIFSYPMPFISFLTFCMILPSVCGFLLYLIVGKISEKIIRMA